MKKSKKKISLIFLPFLCHRKTSRNTKIPVSSHLPDHTVQGQPSKPSDELDIALTAPQKDRASQKQILPDFCTL